MHTRQSSYQHVLVKQHKHLVSFFVCILCWAVSCLTFANNAAQAKWFRYYDNGVPQLSQTITNEHYKRGYEALDSSFRVIKTVPPYSKAEAEIKKLEEEKALAAQNKQQQEVDKLIKTYSSSALALRKRNELLADIQSKRSFALQQLNTANTELKEEMNKAVNLEKKGKVVSNDMKQAIENKRVAVKSAQNTINDLMINQMARVHQMTQDIRRLRKIENANP